MKGSRLGTTLTILCTCLFLSACYTPYHQRAAETGAILGGTAGMILNSSNPWQGGVVGAAIGAIAGATIADISLRGAREVVYYGRPVEYRTDNQRGYYYAEPVTPEPDGRCRRVREKTYVDGQLVKQRTIVICDGNNRYDNPRYRYDDRSKRYERDDDD
jgi:hypothetical protein